MPDHALAVRSMFDRISPTYDLLNRLLSLGIDRRWRARAVDTLLCDLPDGPIVDLCAGTLDLAHELGRRGRDQIIALDLSAEMLARGRAAGKAKTARIVVGDAMELPFDDRSVAGIICGFGVRNLPDARVGAREARRVLAPGGVLVVLDFFGSTHFLTSAFHAIYAGLVLPTVGGLVSRDRGAYRYLAASMKAFLTPAAYARLLREEGFMDVAVDDLTLGVASIVRGTRGVVR